MKLLRVNTGNATATFEDLPEEWKILGGRGISAQIMDKEVPPDTDPLGPDAKLIIAAGPVAGSLAPSCGRISVGGKSPLTMGIKEANAGGPAAQKLDRLGIRAIILEGSPSDSGLYTLSINKDGATLNDAGKYKGMKNYDLAEKLKEEFSNKAAIISIGVAGERGYKSSAVTFTDKDGDCSRHAARGGLGAVMGAKGVKAIVIDDKDAPGLEYANKEAHQKAVKDWAVTIKEDPSLKGTSRFGTTAIIGALRGLGSMPALNYSNDPLEGVENIGGEAIEKINLARGGKMEGCMPGCLVKCSIVFHDADGKHVTSSYEYETIALLGTNLGIVDPDVVAKLDFLCDTIGVDTIEVGSAMGVAASAGKMKMGDSESALALMDEIEKGTEFGKILGDGVVATCKALGIDRIPAYRGQAIPAHDPRVVKPTGVGYATSPMGADHTAVISYDDFGNKEGQVERSLEAQILLAVGDATGYCMLACPGARTSILPFLKDLINARYGVAITEEDLVEQGKDILRTELKFNEGSEFHTANECEPAFVRSEPVGPAGSVFDVDAAEMSTIWDKLDSFKISV